MIFKNLQSKLIVIITILIVIPVALISFVAIGNIDSLIQQDSMSRMEATAKTAEKMYEKFEQEALAFSVLVAKRQDLAQAIKDNDRTKLEGLMTKEYADLKDKAPLLKTLELTDNQGVVVMRGHNPQKWGDDKKKHPMVSKALQGKANSGITVSPSTGKTAMDGIASIYLNGELMGTIKAGFYTNDDIAKYLKESTDTEAFMFSLKEDKEKNESNLLLVGRTLEELAGDDFVEREGTEKDEKTHEEKKVMETFLNNKTVTEKVIGEKQRVVQHVGVNGEQYMASFSPVLDLEGKASGVIMLGLNQKEMLDAKNSAITLFGILGVLSILVGAGLGVIFARKISRPVIELTNLSELMAAGDLTVNKVNVESKDEIGRLSNSFNKMLDNMRQLIQQALTSARQVAETSQQLSASVEEAAASNQQVARAVDELAKGNVKQNESVNESVNIVTQLSNSIDQIAKGAQEQAANVAQTTEMVSQMVKGIDEVTQNAQKVAEAAQQTSDVANKGGEAVDKTITGMQKIKQTVFESAGKIKELGEHSKQIGEIIEVIDDIAEQTNLLALNAAIEAARAGEHGKGFAVVADEVRKLAERSGKATKEIANLIGSIQKGTTNAVEAMEAGTREVEQGAALADDAGVALKEIVKTIQVANEQMESISAAVEQISASSAEVAQAIDNVAAITEENTAATEEMAAGSSQVNTSIKSIASVARESAQAAKEVSAATENMNASTEEIAASAQALAKMAQELQGVINKFKIV
ncbi:MAG: methyl-accepting chemotaxis protein [Clostridia bacterium]|nr:methyl-accepting chemotaxis protein [Clostridia bacterium]